MFDKLRPNEVQESFEACLQACEAARQQKLQQLWDAWDERACQGWEQLANIELSDNDMKDVMNTWLHSPEKWMKPWNLAQLPFMKHQDQHQRKKSLFSTYQFQLIGNKDLVQLFIKLPICSAEQPAAVLRSFMANWEVRRQSNEHQAAIQQSQKKAAGQKRMSQQIWHAKGQLDKGQRLYRQVDNGELDFFELDEERQTLVEDYGAGRLWKRLADLLDRRFDELIARRAYSSLA